MMAKLGLKKINTGNITLAVVADKIIFSYEFEANQEKELNIAAGKVHRGKANDWKIEGNTLSLIVQRKELPNKLPLSAIQEMFEEMVK